MCRKLWNPHNFKAHVSPHEMLQAVASTSNKRFKITEQGWEVSLSHNVSVFLLYICVGDPIDFMCWLLNTLHTALGGSKKPDSSTVTYTPALVSCDVYYIIGIVYKVFQGAMRIHTRKLPPQLEVGIVYKVFQGP